MSFLINILIAVIVLAVLGVASYNYIAETLRSLSEKLNLGRFTGGKKNYGALGEIFYQYHHKSAQEWADATIAAGGETLSIAKNQLLEHINGEPASWGAITPEAIKTLAAFEDSDMNTTLRSVLKTCKRIWQKYIISSQCYEAACESIIKLDKDSAINILKEEIEKRPIDNDDITICIINSFKAFPEEEDISSLFTKILVETKETYKTRSHAVNIAESTRSEEEAHKAFIDAIKEFATDTSRVMTNDDSKIFEQLFNLATHSMDEETFDLIVKCCTSPHLSNIAIKSLDLIIKSSIDEFSPENLYMLINLATDEQGQVANTLANVRKLSADEKNLCSYIDHSNKESFDKSSANYENGGKALAIPREVDDVYEKLKDAFKIISSQRQGGHNCGISLTGLADKEKLYLARALAAEKKLSFIYVVYEEIAHSAVASKELLEVVSEHKPCIIYFDDMGSLLGGQHDNFTKNLKQLLADKMVFIIGTINQDADITESGSSSLFAGHAELQALFPQAVQITIYQDAEKNTILKSKLSSLQSGREAEKWESFNILKPSSEMTPFEFEKFLTKYFRASLLVHGKLIEVSEFERLDGLSFPNRGDL